MSRPTAQQGADDTSWSVVVPTIGRPSLRVLLDSLAAQSPAPREVVVVDDRPADAGPGSLDLPAELPVRVLRSGGRGPAAARNVGWRATSATWVAFVDDDVVLPTGWSRELVADLRAAAFADRAARVGGVSARIHVPAPEDRRPTDAERGVLGLRDAWWATADMAYRRAALEHVGGFDERFPRAYREDADLALRVRRAGWALRRGDRTVVHPLRPPARDASVARQRGNADDALMRALHGPDWRREAGCPRGRLRTHAVTTAAGLAALVAAAAGRRRTAALAGLAWAGLTAEFAARRIAPGPRTPREVAAMVRSSALVPPAAVAWRAIGARRHRDAAAWPTPPVPRAVLFDRDGTLVEDVPYNGDPDRVVLVDGAVGALNRLRRNGLRIGVITNQSGIARGLFTAEDERRVAKRVEELLGPFDTWQVCPHDAADGCGCRKPAPGMVIAAARELRVRPAEIVVVGDIGSDMAAARAAGARAVLVPTPATRPEEVAATAADGLPVARDLHAAVDAVLELAARSAS
jgi:histidinol-phosphate phosphatase family protein